MTGEIVALGTVITSLDQRIVHTDDAFAEIVGREQADLVGQFALSFTYSADLLENRPALDKLAVGGPGFTITKRYVRGSGELVWVRNHVSRFNDGLAGPMLCATTQRISRPFGTNRLARNYQTARRLCQGLVAGRQQLTADIVQAPATEALLWLYRAEIEGCLIDVDRLAAMTTCPPSTMLRWVKLMQERGLIVVERDEALTVASFVRISEVGERALDGLLAGLND